MNEPTKPPFSHVAIANFVIGFLWTVPLVLFFWAFRGTEYALSFVLTFWLCILFTGSLTLAMILLDE